MKRSSALVSYESSDDDTTETVPEPNPPKRRKLPVLSSTFNNSGSADDPSLHQGRVRTAPHVEGQWVAHIFVPLKLEPKSALSKVLTSVLVRAKGSVSILHPIGVYMPENDTLDTREGHELHISLSRPVYLRSHQREDLKRAVKAVAKSHSPFHASFATFSELQNDERTRTFLTAEIGAGHDKLKQMSEALIPTLHSLRQKEFYGNPRFHASIAWALMATCTSNPDSSSHNGLPAERRNSSPAPPGARSSPDCTLADSTVPRPGSPPTERGQKEASQFETIERFPEGLVPMLRHDFGGALMDPRVGAFEVENLCVRIGKEVFSWQLGDV